MRLYPAVLIPAALLCGCMQHPRQATEIPAAAPAPAPAAIQGVVPAEPPVITLPGAICERNRDAPTILKVQQAEGKLTPLLTADPSYGGAWYEHEPCYRLVLAFTDGRPRQWVVDAAPPELRPYLAFGRAKYSLAEAELTRIEISGALQRAGLRFMFAMGHPAERFTIQVPTPADIPTTMQAVPERYRSDVRIFVGDIHPRPE